ncbi:hypothetical protein K503DRAFT_785003 [Rhizopogon vinicolor AM-OR11-026]|uniref:Uncharacterized protein n=1 Tax=Rhizopogon vinicolor AM-OR11-026 TaxID=1314800 RepID=A0A1B7MSK9_9AGAM|nr:hypothetical protein K503DRAFT_785003 [Rhizopogon vinicolor AM-OR11-026]
MQETQLSGRVMRRHSELVRPERQEQINLFTGHPHRQYYGYAVSLDWLIEFVEKRWRVALPAPDARNYRIIARRRAFEFIGRRTGIDLDWQICFNPKGDSVPPEWFASMYGEIDDPKDMEIVTMITVCSDEDCDFEWRPSQDRVDSMTNLIERVPHWWRCLVPPEWFGSLYAEDQPDDLETVAVLAVFSDREDEFERRPTHEQLDCLTKLIWHASKCIVGVTNHSADDLRYPCYTHEDEHCSRTAITRKLDLLAMSPGAIAHNDTHLL